MPSWAFDELIYLDESKLEAVRKEINNYHYFFYNAYLDLIDAANEEMSNGINPVTNKSLTPSSGDKHDYYSIGPYWWPDPDTEDGLPWIYKDGEINPDTKGDNLDWYRSADMFESVRTLSLTYYFSKDERYAERAYQHIHAWFIYRSCRILCRRKRRCCGSAIWQLTGHDTVPFRRSPSRSMILV